MNNLSLLLKREIQEVKNESINSYLRGLTNEKETDYSLWKATKRLERPVVHTTPTRKEDGSWARNDEQKAELYADYLEQIFKPNEQQRQPNTSFVYGKVFRNDNRRQTAMERTREKENRRTYHQIQESEVALG
jgi:hypothetical protein